MTEDTMADLSDYARNRAKEILTPFAAETERTGGVSYGGMRNAIAAEIDRLSQPSTQLLEKIDLYPRTPQGGIHVSSDEWDAIMGLRGDANTVAASPSTPSSPQAVPADPVRHASDCAVHNEPAMPNGPCDCGAAAADQARTAKLLDAFARALAASKQQK
jgi:hypothetical protein